MAKQVITLHLYESTASYNPGHRFTCEADFRGGEFMKDHIWLGQQDVEIDWPEIDTRQAQIDELERQVVVERGQAEHRVNLLLERISKLQAIGHEVAE